ncbi:hypothetical protein ACFLSX_04240 [Calditrichota bacterium]
MDDSSESTVDELIGYSIVEAENLAVARNLADGHHSLCDGKGNLTKDIFELMPVPM